MGPSCTTCKKTSPEVSLKNCAKCKTTLYCSRDCQKADWTIHKKTCGKEEPSDSPSEHLSPPKGLDKPISKPFTHLENGTWLHDRSEKDAYRLLIDAYRLRVEDDYTFDGNADVDSIYGGAANGLRGFKRFLKKTASCPGLLPPWWTPEKQRLCEKLGMDDSQWHCLRYAIEKSDVIEHYGDARFPMQLRMFAEAVYGQGPGGANGASTRAMMMAMERGGSGFTMTHVSLH